MPNYAKGIKDIVKSLSKRAKSVADKATNPRSEYAMLSPAKQSEHVDTVLAKMAKNPDVNYTDKQFLDNLRKRMFAEQEFAKSNEGMSLLDLHSWDPDLHKPNLALEKQADDFLKQNDPEFFEELDRAMRGFEENTTNLPQTDMLEKMSSQYDTDMSEAFNKAAQSQYKKDFLKDLYADEFADIPSEADLVYHLSKDPITGVTEKLSYPKTSLNSRRHNVPVPQGEFYFIGKHKPGSYYHNALWNYINKGPNREQLLDEFFQDIVKTSTPSTPAEKFNTIKRYKDALDARQRKLDLQNKPYNNTKFNNMKAIEEYFENQRPSSFEDFESKYLSPDDINHKNYRDLLR